LINEINSPKTGSEKYSQNVKSSNVKQPPAQNVKTNVSVPAASRSAASLAAAAGLPPDKISASIVSFARFFSLPLKPQVLADIRRQAFTPQLSKQFTSQQLTSQQFALQQLTSQSSNLSQLAVLKTAITSADTSALMTEEKSSAAVKIREALSLAAAAAESKGVELQSKSLEFYAEVIDPELEKRQSEEDKQHRKDKKEQEENESNKTNPITAGSLKKTADEYTEKNPLLDLLNRLPGKNGQRWIVIPFDFQNENMQFKVSMRILLDPQINLTLPNSMNDKSNENYIPGHNQLFNRAACMALDISMIENYLTVDGEKQKNDNKQRVDSGEQGRDKKWLFVFDAANNKPMRLTIFFQPELPDKIHSKLKNELSQILKIPPERISFKKYEGSFPFEANYDEQYSAVDEAV